MKNGFSLVELSIVLVILGLLTGGILAGQNLIRAAELRSVTTQLQGFQTAANTFRDKYFAIPGDMRNATDFWGAMTNCFAGSPSGTGTQTCNGDGDGIIDNNTSASQNSEQYLVWQHLANAGLIEGSYTGIAGAASAADHIGGENAPKTRIGVGCVRAASIATITGNSVLYDGSYGNYFEFGSKNPTSACFDQIFSPEEAWNIDTKADDGKPGTGKISARFWDNACADATSSADFDSDYRLSDTSLQCSLSYKEVF